MGKPPKVTNTFITSRKEAIERMRRIQNHDQEACALVTLSPDYRVIKDHIISLGGFYINHLPIGVLFERVLTDKARFFILGHNHPNGVGLASQADIQVVLRILYVCEFMDVDLVDSIIFPYGKEPSSLRSSNPKIFNAILSDKVDTALKSFIPRKVQES